MFLIKLQALRPAALLKKAPTQVFSCEYCEIFKSTYFGGHLRTAPSEIRMNQKLNLRNQVFWKKVILKNLLKLTRKHL